MLQEEFQVLHITVRTKESIALREKLTVIDILIDILLMKVVRSR